ncbi:MAG: beta-ketoacyl-[acyl-carrier-protein] synthase II [Deltaproteobacteria bacterium]|nr:MAG: beta-ketoacyl-[acyl-carrier-protein] synthase II [Deltaproteobacteria bacterium]
MHVRRVVVTGLGAVSPCGLDAAATWESVAAGRSGIRALTAFDTTDLPVRIGGQAWGFDPESVAGRQELRRLDRYTQFAVAAADEAIRHAGLADALPLGERAGVYIGSGIGGITTIEDQARSFHAGGFRRVSPFFLVRALGNLATGVVSIRVGARGPSLSVCTACATGNHSIGEAWRAIRSGDADLVIAGGAEAPLGPLGLAGFAMMRALSRRNDDPAAASRPFDADRDGFVMSEGAGVLVLEALDHARARGATPLAELVGYALTSDAHHVTAPPDGHEGAARCMRLALASAGLSPSDVDYINAHGTSTPHNDVAETAAIRAVFGDHADRLAVSSTKSVTGHLLGAAGGLEAVLCVQALREGFIPPTANLDRPGEGCDLDYVPHRGRAADLRVVLSNSFGFGGTNACIVLRRAD